MIGPLLQHHLKAKPLGHVLAYTFIEGFECGALKNAYWYGKTPGEGWTKEALEDFGFRERQPEKPVIATIPPYDHPPVPRDLLTPEQAADYLQIATTTLAIWRDKSGRQAIPFVRVGRAVRYRRSDLIEWAQHQASQEDALFKHRPHQIRDVTQQQREPDRLRGSCDLRFSRDS